jgi:hypothetical protein
MSMIVSYENDGSVIVTCGDNRVIVPPRGASAQAGSLPPEPIGGDGGHSDFVVPIRARRAAHRKGASLTLVPSEAGGAASDDIASANIIAAPMRDATGKEQNEFWSALAALSQKIGETSADATITVRIPAGAVLDVERLNGEVKVAVGQLPARMK